MRYLLSLIALLLLPATLSADEASHKAAAEALLKSINIENMMSQSVDQMMQMQVKQNPSLAPYESQMRAFLTKHMSWASLKDDMIRIYTAEFTEQELKELMAFYQTPVGQKSVQKMPVLLQKGAEIGQQKIQKHLPELQAAIQGAGAGKKAP